ncbi:MAG: Xanthine phosphoribosyltransferase [Chroococcopsis gigantea SAG 12.99]|jgi:hypoxanthine phosphoribosyltransferase|nr:Xanthine phosphoribosyltransferase [Chroococcopsis gigantea SAG 12.99]
MADMYVSWEEYHETIEQLAVIIDRSLWQFNQIVCLAKGGLRPGDVLCRLFHKPLAIGFTSSYGGKDNSIRAQLKISNTLTMTTPSLGSHVLLVDDLADSGITLQETIKWLKSNYPRDIQEIRTAVLWYKGVSIVKPDYYVHYLPHSPWIHQPFEYYEKITPRDLNVKFVNTNQAP